MDLRSSAVFCQASLCGLSEAAGRYGDLRDRSKSDDRALIGSRASTGFPAPDLFDHFAHAIRRLLTFVFFSDLLHLQYGALRRRLEQEPSTPSAIAPSS